MRYARPNLSRLSLLPRDDIESKATAKLRTYSNPSWTGLALAKDTSGPPRQSLYGVALLGAAISAFLLSRRRNSRSSTRDVVV